MRPPDTTHTMHAGSPSDFPFDAVLRETCCCTEPVGVAWRRISSQRSPRMFFTTQPSTAGS